MAIYLPGKQVQKIHRNQGFYKYNPWLFLKEKRKLRLIALGVVLVFLAILIPSVTLRAAPGPDEGDDSRFNPQVFAAKPELLEKVYEALKEVPLIDT